MIARLCVGLGACAALSLGCSLGQGEGEVRSERLFARACWYDSYDMQPDFFAAVPFRDTLQIRVQRGNDLQEVSDGLSILVDDIQKIRAEKLGVELNVALPPGVQPPGAPLPEQGPRELSSLVHMALYLQRSCHNQNTVLYAVSGAIVLNELFSGDPNEKDAANKYTDATFDVMVGDPREAEPGAPADAIPLDRQSRVTGFLRFYFERGQPGQPFP
jgi:hypothetical protein